MSLRGGKRRYRGTGSSRKSRHGVVNFRPLYFGPRTSGSTSASAPGAPDARRHAPSHAWTARPPGMVPSGMREALRAMMREHSWDRPSSGEADRPDMMERGV